MGGGMKLYELKAEFVRLTDGNNFRRVDSIAEAQGVMFLCPLCYAANNGSRGTHSVICWSRSRGVPDDIDPKPGRWVLKGTGLDDLTLDGEAGQSRSVLLLGGCGWHGFVTNGETA
ncbi:MAG: hypothetical protein KGL35_18385 [Bradyrhizobium sp.]|nr:hypothetical protein [Bradyrhizobium sp.]